MDNIADMTTTSQDKSSWQSKVDMLLDVLIASAQTITYDEMATQADIPAPHRIHQLTSYLETLIEDDGAQQRLYEQAWLSQSCVLFQPRLF